MADDIARLGYEIDSSQAAGAAKNLLAMSKAAGDAASSAARLEKQARSSNGQFQSASKYAREHASQIRSLAGEFNTTMARQLAFSEGQKRLADAVKLGVVAEKDHAAQLAILKQRYLDTAGAVDTFGQRANVANRHILNMGFQFQDIGMMMASGQSPFILAMQQGTQVSGIFNQIRMEGQKVGPALIGGITQLINPLSLLTIGAIAAGAALVQWGMAAFGAGDGAKSLEDRISELNEIIDNSDTLIGILNAELGELEKTYLFASERTREFALAQAELAASQAERRLRDQIPILRDVVGLYSDVGAAAAFGGGKITGAIRVMDDFGITSVEVAEDVQKALLDVANAADFESQADAMRRLIKLLDDAGIEAEKIPEELQIAINEMLTLIRETDAAKAAMERLAAAAAGVTIGIPLYQQGFSPDELLPPPNTKPKRRGGGGGANRHERELEAFIESLQTESEKLEAWRVEQFELLNQYNEQELAILGGHNEAKLRLEQEYQDRLTALQEQQRSHVKNAQMNALGAFQDFLGTMSGQSEGAAKVLLAVNTALSISQAIQNTAVAATRALAELGPILGPPAAAKIKAFGAIQVGLIAANGALRMATSGNGGGGGGGGAPTSASATTTTQAPERIVRVAFDGPDWARSIIEPIMEQIYEQSRDGTRVIFQR